MKINYQLELEKTLAFLSENKKIPRLLLHSCCAPCSSYVLEYLADYFDIDVFYYNPNISPGDEYLKRLGEQKRFIAMSSFPHRVGILEADYEPEKFASAAAGLENEPERGARCEKCFRLRLDAAARKALETGQDYFATTLSVSPYKDAELLNRIGGELEEKYGVRYLFSDFKKKGGYQRSIELSHQYGLYRQDFCGCEFSRLQRDAQREAQNKNGG